MRRCIIPEKLGSTQTKGASSSRRNSPF